MTKPTPHGQVPAIQRYKIGYASDEWGMGSSTPSGIKDQAGPWVRYEDHADLVAAIRTQRPAPSGATYKDSTPGLHVGDSAFESWYSAYNPAHKADKQRARDAYAAGMGDPLVTASPAPQPAPATQQAGDALSDAVRVPLDSLHADAAYLIGRLREGSMPYARVIEIIRERIDAAKAAIRARAEQGDALDAARYRFLRDGEWRDTDLEPFIRLQLNTLWDAAIDAARKQGGAT